MILSRVWQNKTKNVKQVPHWKVHFSLEACSSEKMPSWLRIQWQQQQEKEIQIQRLPKKVTSKNIHRHPGAKHPSTWTSQIQSPHPPQALQYTHHTPINIHIHNKLSRSLNIEDVFPVWSYPLFLWYWISTQTSRFKGVPMFNGTEVAPTTKQYQTSVNYLIHYSTTWRPLVLWFKVSTQNQNR
jgi:hypothetical protein